MGWFSKKKTIEKVKVPTSELIIMKRLEKTDDAILIDLANELKSLKPLIVNFDLLEVDDANKALAFLSGVVYGIEGSIQHIHENVYLFAFKEAFDDGTLKKFLDVL